MQSDCTSSSACFASWTFSITFHFPIENDRIWLVTAERAGEEAEWIQRRRLLCSLLGWSADRVHPGQSFSKEPYNHDGDSGFNSAKSSRLLHAGLSTFSGATRSGAEDSFSRTETATRGNERTDAWGWRIWLADRAGELDE